MQINYWCLLGKQNTLLRYSCYSKSLSHCDKVTHRYSFFIDTRRYFMHSNSIHLNLKCLFSDINRIGSLFSPPVATSFHTKAANVIKFYVLNQTLPDVCKSFRLWQWNEWKVGLNFMQYFDVISHTLRVPFILLWISVHQQTSGTWKNVKNGNIKVERICCLHFRLKLNHIQRLFSFVNIFTRMNWFFKRKLDKHFLKKAKKSAHLHLLTCFVIKFSWIFFKVV